MLLRVEYVLTSSPATALPQTTNKPNPDQEEEAFKEALPNRLFNDKRLCGPLLYALPGPESLPVKMYAQEGQADSEDEDEGEPMFQILLDVTQFKPEDILIQVFEGWLLIRGRHLVRMDEHGFVSRSFTRHYQLPDDQLQAGDLKAILCHDGILVVETKERWWTAND
ncbi:hypothetical protein DNTS_008717 [Danionella cerebrum]|uniref:SHSP domain-containing protein n=1 Tax=Danionella cerebrum TaxID=2873325 RepID=A0A553NL38_9TELE|nr:hypothetical protein DNTS_008717 [Danionella translucida]